MGVNLYLQTIDGREAAAWDSARLAGDREFAYMLDRLPYRVHMKDGNPYYRPSDFAAWRDAITTIWPNPGRFETMLRLLEADPELWIYVSW